MRIFMGLDPRVYFVPFILVALALTVVAWRRSRSMASLIFAFMMVVAAIWLVASALEVTAGTYVGKVLAAKVAFLGIAWAGTLWLMFSLEFVFPDRNYFLKWGPWLSLVPIATIAAVMTNELHGLVWSRIIPYTFNNQLALAYEHGGWFSGFVVYSSAALAAGCIILFIGIRQQAAGRIMLLDEPGDTREMLAIIGDVSARKGLEVQLQDNLEQQTFINSLLQSLYRPHDLFAALSQVIEQTGLYTKASRVYLCKDSIDGAETSIVLEWCKHGIFSRARESALFRYSAIPTWRNCMVDHGMVLIPDSASAAEDIAEFMAVWNILSLAVFPIYGSEERLYGFLAFDYCETARGWGSADLELLWNVCRIVSGAVAQRQTEEGEHRQRILAAALHDTAAALNSTLNFEEVLDRILTNLEQIVPHDSASIALVDAKGMVTFVRWRGYDPTGDDEMHSLRLQVTDRDTYRIMTETGSPIIIPDTSMDKRWSRHSAYPLIKSYAGMPIKIKGRVAGFINLDSMEPDHFTADLAYSLNVFADQAAVAIENARLYDSTRRRAEEMSILNHIGLTITAGLDMNQVLVSLYEQCRQVLPVDVFYVALYDAESGRIELPLYFRDGQDDIILPRNIHTNPGITGVVIRQRRTISLPDTLLPGVESEYNIIRVGGRPSRSYVGVPLILLNQVVGVISMQNYEPYTYTPEQVSLLETIAIQTAIALQNARIYEQMKQMAITDPVTLLYTRLHFTSLGHSEVERAQRYNRRLSVLMVDIDWFKQVNDTYGHTAGDQVLLIVANACRQALRATDIVGRWGGEEFVIILPEADMNGAALIAERIRRMVAEKEIALAHTAIHMTVSIGVAAMLSQNETLEVLIDCADQAMYAAKQGGRNQVRVADRLI